MEWMASCENNQRLIFQSNLAGIESDQLYQRRSEIVAQIIQIRMAAQVRLEPMAASRAVLGKRQNFRALLSHQNGVLKLS